jgi:hypothetical protein
MLTTLFAVALVALAAVWAILLYNNLLRSRFRTQDAWSGIEVQLKPRAGLIPKTLFAGWFGFAPVVLFAVDEAAIQDVRVSFTAARS